MRGELRAKILNSCPDEFCEDLNRFGIQPAELPHLNKAERSYQMTNDDKHEIYELYREDYEEFNY